MWYLNIVCVADFVFPSTTKKLNLGQPEGMQLGHVKGTYLYGILSSSEARIELLVPLKDRHSVIDIRDADSIIDPLDKMANYLQDTSGLDYKRLKSIISDTNTGGTTKCRDL